jgi:hypothetical protein
MRRIEYCLTPIPSLVADPSARGEMRAASPIDRIEGSIVTEMVANHFRKTQ